jgi:hypothetical protein
MENKRQGVSLAVVTAVAKRFALQYGAIGITDIRLNTEANGIEFILVSGDVVNVPFMANEMPFDGTISDIDADNVQSAIDLIKDSISQTTNVLYVDNKRTDTYTEIGNYIYPYKTIMAAMDSITGNSSSNRFVIKIATGSIYTEAIEINKDFVTLEGYGETILSGTLTLTAPHFRLKNLKVTGVATGTYTIPFLAEISDCSITTGAWTVSCSVSDAYVQISGGTTIWTSDIDLTNVTGVVACQNGYFEGTHTFTDCYMEIIAIENYGGTINLETGSEFHIGASMCIDTIINLKTGADLYTDAVSTGGATLNNTGGTLHLTTSASSIFFDNTTSGLTATDVKSAIDELSTDDSALKEISNSIYVDSVLGDDANVGTITYPVKTIAGLISVAESLTEATGFDIHFAYGTYSAGSSDITLIDKPMRIYGNGATITTTGTITISNENFFYDNLILSGNIVFASSDTGRIIGNNGTFVGNITFNGFSDLTTSNISGGIITINSTASVYIRGSTNNNQILSTGDLTLIDTNMKFPLVGDVGGGDYPFLIKSTGGTINIVNSEIVNTNYATREYAIYCDNDGGAVTPNILANTNLTVYGIINSGTAYTSFTSGSVIFNPSSFGYSSNLTPVPMVIAMAYMALGSDATGDLYYTNSSGIMTKLSIGTDGQFLKSTGTLPQWQTVDLRKLNIVTAPNSTYTILSTDDLIHSTYSATGTVIITIPTAQLISGRSFTIKDAGGLAGTNNITIVGEGGELIDGSANYVINSNYNSITLYSNGIEWYVI